MLCLVAEKMRERELKIKFLIVREGSIGWTSPYLLYFHVFSLVFCSVSLSRNVGKRIKKCHGLFLASAKCFCYFLKANKCFQDANQAVSIWGILLSPVYDILLHFFLLCGKENKLRLQVFIKTSFFVLFWKRVVFLILNRKNWFFFLHF